MHGLDGQVQSPIVFLLQLLNPHCFCFGNRHHLKPDDDDTFTWTGSRILGQYSYPNGWNNVKIDLGFLFQLM